MNQLNLKVTAGNLPKGFCPPDLQSMATGFASIYSVAFPTTFSGVFVSTTPPADETQAWLQVDTLGRPTRLYVFAQGAWLSLHPIPPGFIMIYPFVAPDFTNFDGGDANAAGPASGTMWQLPQDAAGNPILVGQFPLAAGAVPGSTQATVVAAGQSGGEERHILSTQEMPPHTHNVNFGSQVQTGADTPCLTYPLLDNPVTAPTTSAGGDPSTGSGGVPTAAFPHNNMPPWYGVTFIQRTNRLYYAAS